MGVNNILEVTNIARQHFYSFKSIKHAFVSNKPINVALFVMVINSYNHINQEYRTKAFSTQEAAINWLKKSY